MLCLRRCCIARSTRAAKRQITQRAASGSCPGSFQECHSSGSIPLINRTKAIRRQTHVNQPSKSASRETSRQTHAQPLFQYITEATEAPIFESGKSFGAHATPLCGRLPFDTPRGGSGCCEAPCKEHLPWPSGSYPL